MSNYEIHRAAHKVLPITLSSAKEFLRIDDSADSYDEELLLEHIKAATDRIEDLASTVLISREATYIHHGAVANAISINFGPVFFCEWVSVAFGDSDETRLMPSCLRLNKRCSPARLSLVNHLRFPENTRSLKISFFAGYGASPDDVPMQLRQAVLLMLAQLWEHREAAAARPVPMMVDALLMPYRRLAA